ncbi:MAG: hypothetical protein FJ320_09935 [SAR202 cluster bacterium]|nr:hypothetical protein [SAR202 cluster bacterium]
MATKHKEPAVVTPDPGDGYYAVDLGGMEADGRSLDVILTSRRCPDCAEKLKKAKSKPSVKDQVRDITKCCATKEGFISPGMPLREIVFRLLLKGGNRSMSLKDVHYAVTEQYAMPTHPMNVQVNSLKRILDNDTYYGIKRAEAPQPAKAQASEGKKEKRGKRS